MNTYSVKLILKYNSSFFLFLNFCNFIVKNCIIIFSYICLIDFKNFFNTYRKYTDLNNVSDYKFFTFLNFFVSDFEIYVFRQRFSFSGEEKIGWAIFF